MGVRAAHRKNKRVASVLPSGCRRGTGARPRPRRRRPRHVSARMGRPGRRAGVGLAPLSTELIALPAGCASRGMPRRRRHRATVRRRPFSVALPAGRRVVAHAAAEATEATEATEAAEAAEAAEADRVGSGMGERAGRTDLPRLDVQLEAVGGGDPRAARRIRLERGRFRGHDGVCGPAEASGTAWKRLEASGTLEKGRALGLPFRSSRVARGAWRVALRERQGDRATGRQGGRDRRHRERTRERQGGIGRARLTAFLIDGVGTTGNRPPTAAKKAGKKWCATSS